LAQLTGVDDITSIDVLKIILIGDSVTENGCPDSEAVEDALNTRHNGFRFKRKKYRTIDVINGGHIGGDIIRSHEALALLAGQSWKPHVVTVLSGWNDHWYAENICTKIGCWTGENVEQLRTIAEIEDNLNSSCATCRLVLSELNSQLYEQAREDCMTRLEEAGVETVLEGVDSLDPANYRVPLNTFVDHMHSILKLAKKKGIGLVYVIPPNAIIPGEVPKVSLMDCTMIDKDAYLDVHLMYTGQMRSVAKEQGIAFIDLEHIFDSRPDKHTLFFDPHYDPIHPNEEGNALCTEVFIEHLSSYLGFDDT
jgi:hypothetical protein